MMMPLNKPAANAFGEAATQQCLMIQPDIAGALPTQSSPGKL
jgi:hypothetical protein